MSLYKLNRLHLHLTDDQGWRLAIRSWPRLTSHGGQHPGRRRDGRVLHAAPVRRGSSRTPRARFVDVVPEIDMPGHVNAALVVLRRS